jgi:serine phosphatase RsbU (regulator of sigma subunit)
MVTTHIESDYQMQRTAPMTVQGELDTSVADADLEKGLPEYRLAKQRTEGIRILVMGGLFAALVLLGIFRVVVPLDAAPAIGWVVLVISALSVAGELTMLRIVRRAVRNRSVIPVGIATAHALLECAAPLTLMYLLLYLSPDRRYTLLVSPGYAFLMILVAVSVLKANWKVTAMTGFVAVLGYAGLIGLALNWSGSSQENPHPLAMYWFLAVMLLLATAAAAFIALQIESYVRAAVREGEIRRQRDRLKRDLQIASQIQQSLLPHVLPQLAEYEIAAISRPADETGGDYYDWQQIGEHRAVFTLGDVTGHGIGPALVTAACRAYVRAAISSQPLPAVVLERVNGLLHADLTDGRFVTLALVDVDAASHEVRLLSAGHGPTLHVRASDGQVTTFGSQGLPLGIVDENSLDEPIRIQLAPGDSVVVCSDGLFEPANTRGEEYGIERLTATIREHRRESAARLLEIVEHAVRQHLDGAVQPDDMTALVIKRQP